MSPIATLIAEVGGAIERRSDTARAKTLRRITDQFCEDADRLGAETLDVYDGVMQRFAVAVDTSTRAEFAGRLAAVSNGPKGVLRTLAFDEAIMVAGPVLSAATALDDQDLIAATRKGPEHRLAICSRLHVSESVTDVLVMQGERPVQHAIASNDGARFSPAGTAKLLDASRDDERLQDALGNRRDLPPQVTRQLVTIAEQAVRRRLIDTLPSFKSSEVAGGHAASAGRKVRHD